MVKGPLLLFTDEDGDHLLDDGFFTGGSTTVQTSAPETRTLCQAMGVSVGAKRTPIYGVLSAHKTPLRAAVASYFLPRSSLCLNVNSTVAV
jgi:hypothetical protein